MDAIAWNKRHFDNALPKMAQKYRIIFFFSFFRMRCYNMSSVYGHELAPGTVKQATRSVATTINKLRKLYNLFIN